MNDQIKHLVEGLGRGITGPVAYDTAVVACVPAFEDLSKPAFPEALQWIRTHQLSDGSWGTNRPLYAHGNTLSTLAAMIALKKWNNDCDKNLISRGEDALEKLAQIIPFETHESIGYELLIPSLLKKATKYDLKIPFDSFLYSEKLEAKLESIKNYQRKYGFKKKHTFWFSLEMIDGFTDDATDDLYGFHEDMLDQNGSVSASPSATAFFLNTMRVKKGIDVQKAYTYIENLMYLYNGGIPTISPSDTFELSWSLSALIMAGVPPNSQLLKLAIDRLAKKWVEFDGIVGCSSYLPPDSDAVAMFIYVLHSANRLNQSESVNKLLTFYNGSYLECFKGERNPSISANINGLIALRLFNDSPQIKTIANNIMCWLENESSHDNFIFEDKWHISPYYCISRAIFAFQGINDRFAERCVNQLLRLQKSDCGWGVSSQSTLEETAHVTLALCHWFGSNLGQINPNNLKTLQSIDQFFRQFSGEQFVELWIAKVLYCPTTVVSAFIIAAKYCLQKTIQFFKIYKHLKVET